MGSTHKIFFLGYYVLKSRLANLCGVQLYRYVLAALRLAIRRLIYSNNLTPYDMALNLLGICIIEEFFNKRTGKICYCLV